MNAIMVLALVAGALAGFGLYLIVRGALPAGPALGPALQRLHTPIASAGAGKPATGDDGAVARWLAAHLTSFLRPPDRELRLIGRSIERYVFEKVAFTLVGLAFPPIFSLLLAIFGLRLAVAVPLVAAPALAVLFFLLVDVSVKQSAAQAREEFVRAVAVYLDLVALERSAAHGPVESLERAAKVGSGWVFERIREALDGARYANLAPWDGLKQVAADIGVPELGDVGDIMRLSGTEGTQVYQTLVSRAQSLRVALRTREQDRANTATTLLYLPTSMTVFVLFVLAGYPFLIRLITS
jgi:tight adherence protein C